jgi:plasmid stabilization system protein ParE
MRNPGAAARFDEMLRGIFARIREASDQFPEHGLLAVRNGRPLFYLVRRAVLPRPFPYAVFFYVREGVAIVLAVAHAKRRPGYWTDRR